MRYFDYYHIPIMITFEYDETAMYRNTLLHPSPSDRLPSGTTVTTAGDYVVDGYIDQIGIAKKEAPKFVFEMWGRELAGASKKSLLQ